MKTKKRFIVGFFVGVAATLFAVLGLLFPLVELMAPVLVPARIVLAPFADSFQNMPGLLNMFILSLVNGLIYGTAFMLAGFLVRR